MPIWPPQCHPYTDYTNLNIEVLPFMALYAVINTLESITTYVRYILLTHRIPAAFQACLLVGSVICKSSMVANCIISTFTENITIILKPSNHFPLMSELVNVLISILLSIL